MGSERKYLHHVDQDNRHHEIRSPPMHRSDEPAKGNLMIQRLQAAPRFAGRWHINQREQDSRDELQNKDSERSAAEDVPPASSVSRYRMLNGFADRCRQLQTLVEPLSDFANHETHGGFSPVSDAIAAPGVGNSPA